MSPARRVAGAAILGLALAGPAPAQDVPGRFDFYVLSLSWSPSYCASAGRTDRSLCDLGLPGFTVHGLWPQYENGWPEFCPSSQSRQLRQSTIAAIADLMPSARLAGHQWEKHGICSGLRADSYFALLRQAVEKVVIPPALEAPASDLSISPAVLEDAFAAANPGLQTRGMAVGCARSGQVEVRICMTRTLEFRRCAEVDRDTCRRPQIVLPAAVRQ